MKTTAAAAAAAAILGTSLMAPFHSFKSLGGRLVVLGPAWHFVQLIQIKKLLAFLARS